MRERDRLIKTIAAAVRREYAKKKVTSEEMLASAILDAMLAEGTWPAPRDLTDEQLAVALTDPEKTKKSWARLRDHVLAKLAGPTD